MGASYSISGTNASTSHTVGTGNDAVTTAGGLGVQSYAATGVATPGTITAAQGGTNGSGSFSFSQSFTQADIAGTDSTHTDFGNVTVHTGGSTGSAAPGTITNAHVTTLTGTNLAGSSATAQFVSEITRLLTMKRILTALLLLSTSGAAYAVPVVPNFTQGINDFDYYDHQYPQLRP